ncbi:MULTISPECIES: hypothetical protein [Tabrizicola]|uniref:hypothetical protein n=1 Tax=Tabrizicola TaxID=1443919 RepID=UPI0010813C4C|nr:MULTISPECIES: hypothetical protein [Paracoccaceae]
MSAVAIQQMADRVAQLLEERLAVSGRDLAAKLRRGGRLLPRRVREGAELLAVSAERAQNPKLLGQIDMGAVAEAYDACVRHLTAIDPASRRKETIAGMVGFVGYGILFLIVAVIAVLVWRGFL